MSALFIASKYIPHDGSRRVLAVGNVRGPLMQTRTRFGDLEAASRREREQAVAAARGKR